MIGVALRGLSELKLLQPVLLELKQRHIKFILYHYSAPRPGKKYDEAKLENIKKSINTDGIQCKPFTSNNNLLQLLNSDNIRKLLGVELGLSMLKELPMLKNIRTYSIQYVVDSAHTGPVECVTGINRVYYNSTHIMNYHLSSFGVPLNKERDVFIGHPMFDPIVPYSDTKTNDVLLVLPNVRQDNANKKLGGLNKFIKAVEIIAKNNNLIYKTREKQWIPPQILPFASEIHSDGDKMYPTKISELLGRTSVAIQAFSGSIYECVYSGSYTINLDIPAKIRGGADRLAKFGDTSPGGPFNYEGVVENVTLDDIISGNIEIEKRTIDTEGRDEWVRKFIGPVQRGTKAIIDDLLK